MKPIFVTGATGLLGNHVVRTLLAEGRAVRALARNADKAERQFADLPAKARARLTVVRGDMADVPGFQDALMGCGGLIHTAAYFRESYQGGAHFERMVRINVDGTTALFEAALAAGVTAGVHVSSVATVKSAPDAEATAEQRRALDGETDDYFRSKIMSDAALEALCAKTPQLRVAYVLPGFMMGPGDLGPTSAGRMVLDFVRGQLPGVLNARFSFVDARDVAWGCVRALEQLSATETSARLANRRFLIAGRTHTAAEAYAVLARVSGIKAPTLRIPDMVLRVYALGSELFARLTGRPVLMSWAGVQNVLRERAHSRFDPGPAMRELGVTFRPLEETAADTVAFYRAHGLLPAPAA